jgi:hypothetical protein
MSDNPSTSREAISYDLSGKPGLEAFIRKQIESAIAAEREACAKIAERAYLCKDSTGQLRMGDVDYIAVAIRSRSAPTNATGNDCSSADGK